MSSGRARARPAAVRRRSRKRTATLFSTSSSDSPSRTEMRNRLPDRRRWKVRGGRHTVVLVRPESNAAQAMGGEGRLRIVVTGGEDSCRIAIQDAGPAASDEYSPERALFRGGPWTPAFRLWPLGAARAIARVASGCADPAGERAAPVGRGSGGWQTPGAGRAPRVPNGVSEALTDLVRSPRLRSPRNRTSCPLKAWPVAPSVRQVSFLLPRGQGHYLAVFEEHIAW